MRASPVTAQRFKRRRRMTQYDASNSSSSECTVANVTFGFDPGECEEAQNRQNCRRRRRQRRRQNRHLQRLKAHNDVCEQCYEKTLTFRPGEEREWTWHLNRNTTTEKVHEGSNNSDGTIILASAQAAVEDSSVPELRRTDSVTPNRKRHGNDITEFLRSEYSAEEYVPSSDSSAEEDKQHKDKQKEVKGTNSVNSEKIEGLRPKKRHKIDTRSPVAGDSKESSSSDSPDEDPAPRPLEQGQLFEFKGQNLDEIQADPPDKKGKSRVTKKSSTEDGQMTDHHSAEDRMEEMLLSKEVSGESSTAKGSLQNKSQWSEQEM